MLRDRFGVSERRACRVVGQHRSTQRLDPPPITDDERLLREFLRAFSKRRPRWGWRRAAKAARKAGWEVNDKRIRHLWRDEELRVPQKKRKQPLRGIGAPVGAMCPIRPNALWALDFQFDVTVDGRTLKLLNVIDEFTREALAIEVDRSIDADHVVRILDRLAAQRGGAPAFVRFDNGPEFVAHAVADWCRFTGCESVFIDPGSPWQNAWIQGFNGRLPRRTPQRPPVGQPARGSSDHRGLADRLQHQPTPHRPRRPQPRRVRRRLDHQPTPSRIATGPLNGSPSDATNLNPPRPATYMALRISAWSLEQ